jgi:hypothetical protein
MYFLKLEVFVKSYCGCSEMDEKITLKMYKEEDLDSERFELPRPRIRVCWEVMPCR